jgi:phage shock protein PspC (stress-responsive transcriptional regulator)
MNDNDMKKCPFCAEMIRAESSKCRYCGSRLKNAAAEAKQVFRNGYWRRERQGKKIAGVCTGIARQFEYPALILPLRVFFIITTLLFGFGPLLYIAFWLLMPAPGKETPEPGSEGNAEYTSTVP